MEELTREKDDASRQACLYRRLLILFAVLAALAGALAGHMTCVIGNGRVRTDAVKVPKEEFPAYTQNAAPGAYVQAQVTVLRNVFGVKSTKQGVYGSESVLVSSYLEMTLEDGSRCLLTFDGDAETLLGKWITHPKARMQAAYGDGAYAAPMTVYGRVTRLLAYDEMDGLGEMESARSDVFAFKEEGMTDADYWRSLENIAVIDLDMAEWISLAPDARHAAQLARQHSIRQTFLLLAAAVLILAVYCFIRYKKAYGRYMTLVVQIKRSI